MRKETPAERGLRAMQESPDLLESMAHELFKSRAPRNVRDLEGAWAALSDSDRQVWRDAAIECQKELIALPEIVRRAGDREALRKQLQRNDDAFALAEPHIEAALDAAIDGDNVMLKHHSEQARRAMEES